MKIGKNEVITPYDSESYWPAWRAEIAAALFEQPSEALPSEIADDVYIRRYLEYLRGRCRLKGEMPPGFSLEHIASKWAIREQGSPIKLFLEPLLLTVAPFEIVDRGFGFGVDLLRCYERLFFAVRTDDGKMMLSPEQRRRLAYDVKTPESSEDLRTLKWRVTGAVGDYNALIAMLCLRNSYWEEGPSFTLDQFDAEGELGQEIKKNISESVSLWKKAAALGGPPIPDALRKIGSRRRIRKHHREASKYAHLRT